MKMRYFVKLLTTTLGRTGKRLRIDFLVEAMFSVYIDGRKSSNLASSRDHGLHKKMPR